MHRGSRRSGQRPSSSSWRSARTHFGRVVAGRHHRPGGVGRVDAEAEQEAQCHQSVHTGAQVTQAGREDTCGQQCVHHHLVRIPAVHLPADRPAPIGCPRNRGRRQRGHQWSGLNLARIPRRWTIPAAAALRTVAARCWRPSTRASPAIARWAEDGAA